MADLMLQVNMNTTTISVSYEIQPDLAYRMLKTFMDAKLLHIPADRTRSELKDGILIQPTPKGVAVLQRYVRQAGLKELPPILKSSLNSMELFCFERSSMTDAIVHSDYFISLLFGKIMGPSRNRWSPDNDPERLPALSKLLEYTDDSFTFENVDFSQDAYRSPTQNTDQQSASDRGGLQDEFRSSPLAHRFFTNPDSTSHVQYYVSSSGVRLFRPMTFGSDKTLFDCVFSTKAIWQWLMDCTDIMYPKEAVTIASLFLRNGLISPITLHPSENKKNKFSIGPRCYFTLAELGWESVQWDAEVESISVTQGPRTHSFACNALNELPLNDTYNVATKSDSNSSSEYNGNETRYYMDLNRILRDPGMRYLFRTHLESEFCAENLDVYIEIKKFLKRMTVLKNLIDTRSSKKEHTNQDAMKSKHYSHLVTNTLNRALFRQANECLETAYQIYSSFITPGSPYQLNIDHTLRESITQVIMYPQPRVFVSCSEDATMTENFMHPKRASAWTSDTNHDAEERISLNGKATTPCATGESSDASELAYRSHDSQTTPDSHDLAESALSSIIKTLKLINPLFEKVAKLMYRLMKIDSLPKFINSELYQEAAVMLNFEAKIA